MAEAELNGWGFNRLLPMGTKIFAENRKNEINQSGTTNIYFIGLTYKN